MQENWQDRTTLLIGEESLQKLKKAHVFIAGLGGVGGYAAEQLCRAGIGKLTIADNDTVHPSNRNRQIIALTSSEGKKKTDLIFRRLRDINPDVGINVLDEFLDDSNIPEHVNRGYDVILDAIDTLTPKVLLISESIKCGIKILSAMGSGGKLDPQQIRVGDIRESHGCKFAYKVRKALHAKGIWEGVRVVYSPEKVPGSAVRATDGTNNKRSVVGTISYMPAIFGCICAAEVLKIIRKD